MIQASARRARVIKGCMYMHISMHAAAAAAYGKAGGGVDVVAGAGVSQQLAKCCARQPAAECYSQQNRNALKQPYQLGTSERQKKRQEK